MKNSQYILYCLGKNHCEIFEAKNDLDKFVLDNNIKNIKISEHKVYNTVYVNCKEENHLDNIKLIKKNHPNLKNKNIKYSEVYIVPTSNSYSYGNIYYGRVNISRCGSYRSSNNYTLKDKLIDLSYPDAPFIDIDINLYKKLIETLINESDEGVDNV